MQAWEPYLPGESAIARAWGSVLSATARLGDPGGDNCFMGVPGAAWARQKALWNIAVGRARVPSDLCCASDDDSCDSVTFRHS